MKKFLVFALIFSVLLSGGCGGGGGGSSSDESNNPSVERPDDSQQESPVEVPEVPDDNTPIVDDPDDYLWLSIPSTVNEFYELPNARFVSLDDPLARAYDTRIITPELLAKAKSHYEVTAEHHPRWSGFQLDVQSDFCALENANIETTAHAIELQGKYGFNMARIGLNYFILDNDDMQRVTTFNMEGTLVNLNMLRYYDRCIATAIKYDMHINFMFLDFPGFWTRAFDGDWESNPEWVEVFKIYCEVDLWTNPKKRETAKRMINLIAERYRGIPNATFSIGFGHESGNQTLSGSDNNAPERTLEDITSTFTKMAEGVREADPDRLMIIEMGQQYSENEDQYSDNDQVAAVKEAMDKFGNYIYQDNLGIGSYIYHGMNAWDNDEEDRHNIDFHNTTSRIAHYPVTWYGVCDYLCPETPPYEITGFMPKGTVINLHLKNLWGAKVIIKADDVVLKEQITPNTGDVEGCIKLTHSYPISSTSYMSPYVISAEIPEGTSMVTISAEAVPEHDGWAVGVGLIEVVYPEEYAVTNYYYKTTYSAYLDGERDHYFTKQENSILIGWGGGENFDFARLREKGLTSQKIVLNPEDMSWHSPQPELIFEKAGSAEVFQQGENLSRFNDSSHVLVRHENVPFTAAFWEDIMAYYEDIYDMCEANGFSVVGSWDWSRVCNFHEGMNARIVNMPETMEFDIYEHFIWEWFQFFIDHQSKDR